MACTIASVKRYQEIEKQKSQMTMTAIKVWEFLMNLCIIKSYTKASFYSHLQVLSKHTELGYQIAQCRYITLELSQDGLLNGPDKLEKDRMVFKD